MRFAAVLAILALPLLARAQAPQAEPKPDVPPAYVAVDKVETLTLYVRDKKLWVPPLRTDLKAGLQEMYETLEKQFGLNRETLKAGVGRTGLFKDLRRGAIHLVVFDRVEEHSAWLDANGTRGDGHFAAADRNTFALLLEDGRVTADAWAALWHEMTHQFFRLVLFTRSPVWLREGVAEYFAFANKRVKVAETKEFAARTERLKAAADAGTVPRLRDLLRTRPEAFKRAHADAAWVAVSLFMTYSNLQLNNLIAALAQLEGEAVDKLPGVVSDLYRYADLLVLGLLGGEEKAQAAYEGHVQALLANAERPKKGSVSIGEIQGTILPDANGRMDEGLPLTDPRTGVRYVGVRYLGIVHYRAPWAGRMRVTGASEDRHKDRSPTEVTLLDWTDAKPGQKIRVDNETFPTVGGACWGVVIVTWEPSEGGVYRTELKFRYP